MKYKRLDYEELRNLCIRKNWFTCGNCEQYAKLFTMNDCGATPEQLACYIYVYSDDTRDDINVIDIEDALVKAMRIGKEVE